MKKTFCIFFVCFSSLYVPAQNWEQVGLGAYYLMGGVTELYTDTINNLLYGGGNFKTSTGDTIFGIAKWDGTKWDSLGSGISPASPATAITMYNGELYISGWITSAGGILVNGIAKWDGTNWDSVGIGTGGSPDLLVYNNELYAPGFFQFDNGVVSKIAKWDGVKWDSVGSPSTYQWFSSGGIYALGDFNGSLFLGGPIFAGWTSEGQFQEAIIRFDGSNWQGAQHGVHKGPTSDWCSTPVNVFTVYNDQLFIGGCFFIGYSYTEPNIGNNIVRWDGDSLHDVGGGANYVIYDLAVFNNELYAVGDFSTAGGVAASGIAKWDGTRWCGLGSKFNGTISTIEVYNNELYIGGWFTDIDGSTINRVAKWIGGNFTDTCGVLIGIEEETKIKEKELLIYPNPTTGLITITGLSQNEDTRITAYNVLGELVHDQELNGPDEPVIDLSALPTGLYLIQLQHGQMTFRKKVIKQH